MTFTTPPLTGYRPFDRTTMLTFPENPVLDARILTAATTADGHGRVAWLDAAGTAYDEPAGPSLLDARLYSAARIRTSKSYPGRRSNEGYYYSVTLGRHIWHESLLEGKRLATLDATGDLSEAATQPVRLEFAGAGKWHFPDFLLLHRDGRQALYDVKPAAAAARPQYVAQFAATKAMCDRIGWEYHVLTDCSRQAEANLAYLHPYRYHHYAPDAASQERTRAALAEGPRALDAVARLLAPARPSEGRSHVFHLLWAGDLLADLNAAPINSRTRIEGVQR